MAQELSDLAVILEEADHRLVASCQFPVRLVSSRIVNGPAVEDIASAVAGHILRDSLLVGEAVDLHFETTFVTGLLSKTWKACQSVKHLHKIRIGLKRLFHQFPQICQSRSDAHDELSLLLHQTSEAIGPENLKGSEKDEQTKPSVKSCPVDVGIFLKSFEIAPDHPFLQPLRVAEPCLPDKGRHIIIYRASAASLEIDEIWFSVLYHHVSCIEVAVEERVA